MPVVPTVKRNLRPLRSTSCMPTMVMRKLRPVKSDVAPVGEDVGEAALQEDVGVEADDGVDAGGGVAGEDDAGKQEGEDVLAAEERV